MEFDPRDLPIQYYKLAKSAEDRTRNRGALGGLTPRLILPLSGKYKYKIIEISKGQRTGYQVEVIGPT